MKPLVTSILSLLLLFSSCAFHKGTSSSNVNYNGNNAEIIDLVSAQNSTTRILGMGGLNKEALILETKRKMYQQNPLKRGQVYANIGVDIKHSFYLLVDIKTVTVSADVLQFYSDTAEHQVFSKLAHHFTSYDKISAGTNSVSLPFAEGQSIYFLDQKKVQLGKVKSVMEDQLRISSLDEKTFYVDMDDSFHQIVFSDSSTLEEVQFNNGETTSQGYIVGYNEKSFVIRYQTQLLVIKKTSVIQ